MDIYTIYKYTSPSGKSYIGQTKNLTRRIYEHQKIDSNCTYFNKAIQKYGFENFILEILAEGVTDEEANILEPNFILEYNTLAPNGYNLLPGGKNHTHLEETKQKISNKKKGVSKSPEHVKKMSESRKGKIRGPYKIITSRKGIKRGPGVYEKMLATRMANKEAKLLE